MKCRSFIQLFFTAFVSLVLSACFPSGDTPTNSDDICPIRATWTAYQPGGLSTFSPLVGAPIIKAASVEVKCDGPSVQLLLSNTLSTETMTNIAMNGNSLPLLMVARTEMDQLTGLAKSKVYGYYADSISMPSVVENGFLYQMKGRLVDECGMDVLLDGKTLGMLIGGDKIAFNIPYDVEIVNDEELRLIYSNTFGASAWNEMIVWTEKTTFFVTSSTGERIDDLPEYPNDWIDVVLIGATSAQ